MQPRFLPASFILLLAALLAACNPTYNWRDHTSGDGSFRVQFPSKPSTHTRSVDLGGLRVDMTMTAAEVEGTTFAVGTALTSDAAQAQAILPAMRHALLRNIGAASTDAGGEPASPVPGIDATGSGPAGPVRIVGRFVAKEARVYQVIVAGKPGAVSAEHIEQFLDSFTPQ